MTEQRRWEEVPVQLHNMQWNPTVIPDSGNQITASTSATPQMPIPDTEQSNAPKLDVSTPIPQPKNLPHPEPVSQVSTPSSSNPGEKDVHCLPAKIHRFKDDLYATESATIQYGNPFLFSAKMISISDLELTLWTARSGIDEGSILFPRDGTRRWWRVKSSDAQGVGFIIRCIPSSEQPSFH